MTRNRADERALEQLLVLRAQVGEPTAHERLGEMHGARLRYYVRRLVRDADAVEDVVQDTWLAVVRRIASLDDPGAFRAWMYRIARNLVTTRLRRRRALLSLDDPDHADDAPVAPDPTDDALEVDAFGASDIRSAPVCVFGNAITSRMLSKPPMSMTQRSRPRAMPPCGGAP